MELRELDHVTSGWVRGSRRHPVSGNESECGNGIHLCVITKYLHTCLPTYTHTHAHLHTHTYSHTYRHAHISYPEDVNHCCATLLTDTTGVSGEGSLRLLEL